MVDVDEQDMYELRYEDASYESSDAHDWTRDGRGGSVMLARRRKDRNGGRRNAGAGAEGISGAGADELS